MKAKSSKIYPIFVRPYDVRSLRQFSVWRELFHFLHFSTQQQHNNQQQQQRTPTINIVHRFETSKKQHINIDTHWLVASRLPD
jgi:hypothetical protein